MRCKTSTSGLSNCSGSRGVGFSSCRIFKVDVGVSFILAVRVFSFLLYTVYYSLSFLVLFIQGTPSSSIAKGFKAIEMLAISFFHRNESLTSLESYLVLYNICNQGTELGLQSTSWYCSHSTPLLWQDSKQEQMRNPSFHLPSTRSLRSKSLSISLVSTRWVEGSLFGCAHPPPCAHAPPPPPPPA